MMPNENQIWRRTMSIVLLSVLCMLASLSIPPVPASAHSGRTDGYGGHYNRKEGTYHPHGAYTPQPFRRDRDRANDASRANQEWRQIIQEYKEREKESLIPEDFARDSHHVRSAIFWIVSTLSGLALYHLASRAGRVSLNHLRDKYSESIISTVRNAIPALKKVIPYVAIFLVCSATGMLIKRIVSPFYGDSSSKAENYISYQDDERSFAYVTPLRGVNLRSQPAISAPRQTGLPRGTRLELRGAKGEWLQVVSQSGENGWVHANYVSVTRPLQQERRP
ncbi:MAG: hypothetical protein CME19_05415 [Gemmatimonadetes bacterium]|nr:hypothetical protein [Gemmatimonadota bacterium]